MGRMAIMLKNIKENKDLIAEAKATLNTTKLPPGLLSSAEGKEDMKEHV